MNANLVAVLEPLAGGKHVEIDRDLVVGRNKDCDVFLDSPHVSNQHACLLYMDGAVWLRDLNSTNGTFWNGERIHSDIKLSRGDSIRFDKLAYRFDNRPIDAGTVLRPAEPTKAPWVRYPAVGSKTVFVNAEDLPKYLRGLGSVLPRRDIRQPYLAFQSGQLKGNYLRLQSTEKLEKWRIGRHEDMDVILPEPGVSDYHADLMKDGAKWRIADQLSLNGTFVNDEKVSLRYLNSGDQLRFGSVTCVFHFPVAGQALKNLAHQWARAALKFIGAQRVV